MENSTVWGSVPVDMFSAPFEMTPEIVADTGRCTLVTRRLQLVPDSPGAAAELTNIILDPRVYAPYNAGFSADSETYRGPGSCLRQGATCDPSRLSYTARDQFNGKIVGSVNLDWAHINYFVSAEYWRQGYGWEMVDLFLCSLVGGSKFDRIYATVLRENIASRKILEKGGFMFKGLERTRCPGRGGALTILHYELARG